MKKPVWPKGKRIPKFASYQDEVKFWHTYDFVEDADEAGWEEVPQGDALNLNAAEVRALKRIAKRRGLSVQRVLEQLIRDGIRKAG